MVYVYFMLETFPSDLFFLFHCSSERCSFTLRLLHANKNVKSDLFFNCIFLNPVNWRASTYQIHTNMYVPKLYKGLGLLCMGIAASAFLTEKNANSRR